VTGIDAAEAHRHTQTEYIIRLHIMCQIVQQERSAVFSKLAHHCRHLRPSTGWPET